MCQVQSVFIFKFHGRQAAGAVRTEFLHRLQRQGMVMPVSHPRLPPVQPGHHLLAQVGFIREGISAHQGFKCTVAICVLLHPDIRQARTHKRIAPAAAVPGIQIVLPVCCTLKFHPVAVIGIRDRIRVHCHDG